MGIAEHLARLPIFPLPDLVHFPGTDLPLHVFEPRYVAMVRDLMAGGRQLGMARLRPGFQADYHGRPPVFPLATLGLVVACQEIPGDRFAILVRGVERIAIEREHPPERAYREVAAAAQPDRAVDDAALAVERAQLVAVCERIAAGLGERGGWLSELVHQGAPLGLLTNALADSMVRDPAQRQALFEERDPAVRLGELLAHAAELLARLGGAPGAAN